MKKKPQGEHKPYVINRGGSNTADVLIYEQIGNSLWEEGVTAKAFAKDLQAKGKLREINVRINSPGGSVFDGLAIYNTLKSHPAKVNVFIDGMALSIASVIAMAGDRIEMAQNALMMIHNPHGAVAGTAADIRQYADMLDKVRDAVLTSYVDRTGMEADELIQMLDDETWMTAEEAMAHGFVDDTTEQLAMAASADLPSFISVPDDIRGFFETETPDTGEILMADKKDNAEVAQEALPQAATVEQLKAMPGADAEFIVDQLSLHVTLDDAKDALNARLLDRLTAAEKQIAELTAAAASLPSKPAAPDLDPAQPVDIGCDPLPTNSVEDVDQSTSPWGDSPAQFHAKLMRELRNEGVPADKAFERIANDYPELMEALCG